jgi:predicted nucleotide-binding protein
MRRRRGRGSHKRSKGAATEHVVVQRATVDNAGAGRSRGLTCDNVQLEGAQNVADVKLFIGSSGSSVPVGDLIANRLERMGSAKVRVWNEGVFTLNQGVLDRLLDIVKEYDFAVMIWGPDDVTESMGGSSASPRDNVIFECGLFMGALGKGRVFIVCDSNVNVKVPSDFAGITLAYYDGSRVDEDGESAIRSASDKIAAEIGKPRMQEFVGEWRSRFVKNADLDRNVVVDDVYIIPSRDGILINSLASKIEPYRAQGRICKNQVIGEWRHKSGENFIDGTFMLVLSPRANVLYGYCTGRDENGGMIFATWVMARKGNEENKITQLLSWGQQALKDHTMTLPLPESGKP